MRILQIFNVATILIAGATAFTLLTDIFRSTALGPLFEQLGLISQQAGIMNPGPVQPPSADQDGEIGNGNGNGSGSGSLTIADILPKSRNINIFASLTRDVSAIANRLDSAKAADNTTLLAPLNSAMQALPRKPWEDRPGDDSGVSAQRDEDKAARNLERFVNEHVVPVSPWLAGKEHKIKTLGGQEVWWEERDGKKVLHPGEVVVDGVVGSVGNGEIWSLKGVVNYS